MGPLALRGSALKPRDVTLRGMRRVEPGSKVGPTPITGILW